MTNFEKYKEKIQTLVNNNKIIAIINGIPCDCEAYDTCDLCELRHYNDETEGFLKWALKDYVEKPKLTPRERKFCELALTGYITRDADGLFYFSDKPKKHNLTLGWRSEVGHCVSLTKLFPDVKFDFIKSTDEEPWNVKDLLKLKVVGVECAE